MLCHMAQLTQRKSETVRNSCSTLFKSFRLLEEQIAATRAQRSHHIQLSCVNVNKGQYTGKSGLPTSHLKTSGDSGKVLVPTVLGMKTIERQACFGFVYTELQVIGVAPLIVREQQAGWQ